MKKALLFLILYSLFSVRIHAQAPDWIWVEKGEGNYQQNFGDHVATDPAGNSYVIGTFGGTVGKFGSFTLTGGGASSSDIFIAKYDSDGNCLWAQRAGGSCWDLSYGGGIAIDTAGNCYVTGNFEGTATFGSFSLTAAGPACNCGGPLCVKNVFVAKYDKNGTCLWVKKGSSTQNGWGFGVTVDPAGNCYLGGWWEASNTTTITFGSFTLTPSTPNDREIFIVKYDSNGNEQWAKRAGGPQADECHHISNDSLGNVYITGFFKQTATFGTISVTASGTFGDIFVAKYDPNGTCLWVKQSTRGGINTSNSISTDKAGNSFITGNFTSDTLIFDTFKLAPYTSFNVFLAKYDANGNVMWAVIPPQTGSIQAGNDTHADQSGGCYVTGNFMGSITFGSTTLTCLNTSSDEDNFIAKYDNNGAAQWALQGKWAKKSSQSGGISTDAMGNIYLSGGFADTVLFGNIQMESTLSGGAMFIAKIGQSLPPVASLESSDSAICANDCINFTDLSSNATSWKWSFQGANPLTSTLQNPFVCYSTAGTYHVTLIASNGSASDTITLNNLITVYAAPPTPVITQQGNDTLLCSTDPTYTSYQWYLDSVLIPGATDTLLIITQGGNYNVQVTNEDGCSIAVGTNITVGLQTYNADKIISIFPNPAGKELKISVPDEEGIEKIEIYNVMGKMIYQSAMIDSQNKIDISFFPVGVYMVRLYNGKTNPVCKFIKQ